MDEEKYFEYGKNNNTECKHNISRINHCSHCVFEVLCRLEETKEREKQKVIAKSEKNIY